MKSVQTLLLVPALLLAACSSPQPASPAPEEIPWNRYLCESSEQLRAHYPDENHARVELRGQQLDLRLAVSASGARYVGHGLEWWTKGSGAGSDGILLQHLPDGSSGDILDRCQQLPGTH